MNKLYPIFLKLKNKKCTVIGGGNVALRKVLQLLECEGKVEVTAKEIIPGLSAIDNPDLTLHRENFSIKALDDSDLVFICTDKTALNREILSICKKKGILANICDSPELSDFYSASVVSRGDLKIAVSANNKSCSFVQRIRKELEKIFDARYANALSYLGKIKEFLKSSEPDIKKREKIIRSISNSEKLLDEVSRIPGGGFENINVPEEINKWASNDNKK